MQIKRIKYIKLELPKPKYQSPEDRLFYAAKQRARMFDREFTITRKDIFIPPYCPVLSWPLLKDGPNSVFNPSIDRIDNTKGYTKDNIVIVCQLANSLKSNKSIVELMALDDTKLSIEMAAVKEFYKKFHKDENNA